jgi:small subunit ribosomal protein S15
LITTARRAEILRENQRKDGDTGSCEVQTALLTARIDELTEHVKQNPKDHNSRRGLLILVGRRRALLDYLRRRNEGRYQALVQKLGIRK